MDARQYPIKGGKNFLVFYHITDEGIGILRVLHGSRDLEALLGKDN
jgi:toxin ParE1/3/4